MEIYRQANNTVKFQLPAGVTDVEATAAFNDGTPITLQPVSGTEAGPVREFTLPYIPDEGTVKVFYKFKTETFSGLEDVTVTDTYDVVTPVLSDEEVKEVHPNATDDEIARIEKATRHIINAHTGQRFGRFVGTKKIAGNDSNALFLPERLLSIETVNGQDASKHFHIDADGYVLRHYPWGVPPVKADYFGLHMHTGGVIHNPNGVKLGDWYRSKTYEINGVWGWDEVPSQVREAAKLLVNDYACADNAYRDRYLTSMTAADWRIQFHAGAFAKTGNVRADQLLSDFVLKRGWAVI